VDYGNLARQEWTFITLYKEKMSPVELHDEVEKLPTFHDDAQSTDAKLADLEAAIGKLKAAHHDLMNAANGKDAETLKAKIADFEAAGSNLGNFYQSLSGKSSTSDKSGSDKSGTDTSTGTDKKE
jgi:t-SNARE complex subunit (syntaxin)